MAQSRTALILGATGGIGGEVARRLYARGWQIRALTRRAAKPDRQDGFVWKQGDAMREADVAEAAQGTSLIVHAVNPPGYRNWGELVLPMVDNSIAAARSSGARILLPGTLYNYGSGTEQPITEDTPQNPTTRKGAIRAEMERRLEAAAGSGVRTLIVRGGDFFGPLPGNNWFSQGMVKPGRPVKVITYPGGPGVGHSWAYLPDVAEAMVRIVNEDARLQAFETFHFRGHWDEDGLRMIEAIRSATGIPQLPVRRLPWMLFRLLSPAVTLFREMTELRYLWRESFDLDNTRLVRFLGSEPHTPIVDAVRETLRGLGCLSSDFV